MLPAPPSRVTTDREALGRALRAVPKGTPTVLVLPADGSPLGLTWQAGGVVQGRTLPTILRAGCLPVDRRVMINTDVLTAICKASRATDLDCEYAERELIVRAAGCKYGIRSEWRLIPPRLSTMPEAPTSAPATTTWTVRADELATALARVLPAVGRARDMETRTITTYPAIEGLLIEFAHQGLRLVGTDGRHLASQWVRTDEHGDPSIAGSVVLPPTAFKPLMELAKAAGGAPIALGVNEDGWIVARSPRTEDVLATRKLAGRYPDWRGTLPETHRMRLRVQRIDLDPVVRVAEQWARKADAGTPGLTFTPSGVDRTTVRVTCDIPGQHLAWDVPAEVWTDLGRCPAFTLSPLYLHEFVKALGKDGTIITIDYQGKNAAISLDGADGFTFLVAPIAGATKAGGTKIPKPAEPAAVAVPQVEVPPPAQEPGPAPAPTRTRTGETKPCGQCATTGGGIEARTGKPYRSRGLCRECYNRARRPRAVLA